jgi:hypothetical protein
MDDPGKQLDSMQNMLLLIMSMVVIVLQIIILVKVYCR